VSAIRRDQTDDRALADLVQWDAKFELLKINPLLHWTRGDVWKFLLAHEVPYNPLTERGYPSIGCWPCTRPVAGRWVGTDRKECGLHVIELRR
jgi:phosphoadenosine phosphosulfate reductase